MEPTQGTGGLLSGAQEDEEEGAQPERDVVPGSPVQTGTEPYPEGTNGTGSHRPAHEADKSVLSASGEGGGTQTGRDDFRIEPTSREDSLKPLQTPTAAAPGEDSTGTSASGNEEMGWGNIALDSDQDQQGDDKGIDLAEGTGYQPPPDFDEAMQESPTAETAPPADRVSMPSKTAGDAPPKKARPGLLILLVLAVLGAGGYFAYPKVIQIVNPQKVKPVGTLILDRIQVSPLSREDGNLIYTVRGLVRNESSSSVGMIQVEAQFRNASGTVVAKSDVYCGNTFEDKEIASGDLGKILNDLQNELGQSLSNSGIQPGQSVPFLVVLENPPSDVSKVTVTISGFKETT